MATSPMLAGLLGGNNEVSSLALGDPALAAALPDIQLGQSMQQQGLSTAPAYPMQAFGRLAQALAGGFVQRQATSALAEALGGQAEHMSAILKKVQPNNPLIPMLDDPMTRAWALQNMSKMVLAQQEVHGGPATNVYTTSGNLGNPNAFTSPVPIAKQPAFEGAIKEEEARGGERGKLGIPAGVPSTPETFSEAASKRKGAETTAEKTAEAQVKFGPTIPNQAPPAEAKGPGFSEPLPSGHGTQIPPLNQQSPLPQSPAEMDQKLKEWTETRTKWQADVQPTQLALQRLSTIQDAYKSIQSGSWTTDLANMRARLNGVGIHIADNVLPNPNAVQLSLHENYAETMDWLKAHTNKFTQMEFKITSENKQHPNLMPEANLQMIAEDAATLRQHQDVVRDWQTAQKAGWKDPQSYEEAWLRHNKLRDYVNDERKRIGPLKGMSPTAALPRYSSPEDVHDAARLGKINPGEKFLAPNGQLGTVPNAQ